MLHGYEPMDWVPFWTFWASRSVIPLLAFKCDMWYSFLLLLNFKFSVNAFENNYFPSFVDLLVLDSSYLPDCQNYAVA